MAIIRTHGRARTPRRGSERATHLCSFGRMWPSSPRKRAKAIVRTREACRRTIKMVRACGGSSDDGFWQSQIVRPRHQEGAAAPLPLDSLRERLEELYHGGVSPT
ncbi:hypothetical protein PIB30_055331 [Stylosanthes scabra]|uniref:Uncharacterized protein n=1 Tax=Stylosanthes scabra TaxID=79078 RepID=A0ABU6TKC6_9FABA|nr:hypothetical protein [Stylosanthes scabra]